MVHILRHGVDVGLLVVEHIALRGQRRLLVLDLFPQFSPHSLFRSDPHDKISQFSSNGPTILVVTAPIDQIQPPEEGDYNSQPNGPS